MDLDLSIMGFAERCGPAYNRAIWAVFRVVAKSVLLSQICAESLCS